LSYRLPWRSWRPPRRAPAEAARVELRTDFNRYGLDESDSVIFRAAPGETNDVEVAFEGEEVVVTDRLPILPGRGCVAEGAMAAM
jgi:hypothetical protein